MLLPPASVLVPASLRRARALSRVISRYLALSRATGLSPPSLHFSNRALGSRFLSLDNVEEQRRPSRFGIFFLFLRRPLPLVKIIDERRNIVSRCFDRREFLPQLTHDIPYPVDGGKVASFGSDRAPHGGSRRRNRYVVSNCN